MADRTTARRLPSGLWLPTGINFGDLRKTKRTVRFKSTGERAQVSVDDSGTVMQIETAERMDAIVRPGVVRLATRMGVRRR